MPFTPSHAVIALPFVRTPLVPAAIAVGAMAPDIPLFLRGMPLHYGLTHSLAWLPLTVAVALVLLLIWRCVLRPAVRELSPRRLADRLPSAWDAPGGIGSPGDILDRRFSRPSVRTRHPAPRLVACARRRLAHRVGPVHARGAVGRRRSAGARSAVGPARRIPVAPARVVGARARHPGRLGCAVAAAPPAGAANAPCAARRRAVGVVAVSAGDAPRGVVGGPGCVRAAHVGVDDRASGVSRAAAGVRALGARHGGPGRGHAGAAKAAGRPQPRRSSPATARAIERA